MSKEQVLKANDAGLMKRVKHGVSAEDYITFLNGGIVMYNDNIPIRIDTPLPLPEEENVFCSDIVVEAEYV